MSIPFSKRLSRTAAAIAGVSFLAGCGLWVYYAHRLPAEPDAAAMRVYRLAYHGASVYLTRGEAVLLGSLFITALAAFAAGVVLDLWSRRERAER
jgi:hypothetical protein